MTTPKEKQRNELLRKWLPTAVGVGVATVIFGAGRRQSLGPKGSTIRKFRKMIGKDMKQGDLAWRSGASPGKRTVDQRINDYISGGANVDMRVPTDMAKEKGRAVWQRSEVPVSGTINPALGLNQSLGKKTVDAVAGSRNIEAKIVSQYTKAMPVTKPIGKHPKGTVTDLNQVRDNIKKDLGEFVVKPNTPSKISPGFDSGVNNLTDQDNFNKLYQDWLKIKPTYLQDAKNLHPNRLSKKYSKIPEYKGHLVEEIIQGNAVAQQRIKPALFSNNKPVEFRVHAIGGQVAKDMTLPRHKITNIKDVATSAVNTPKVNEFVQKEFLNKLPEEARSISMGVDVIKGADGKFRVLETNMGGDSGYFDIPGMRHRLHHAVTGRRTVPDAAGRAVAGGGLAGFLTHLFRPNKKVDAEDINIKQPF
jgi:hypothetical protein